MLLSLLEHLWYIFIKLYYIFVIGYDMSTSCRSDLELTSLMNQARLVVPIAVVRTESESSVLEGNPHRDRIIYLSSPITLLFKPSPLTSPENSLFQSELSAPSS